MSYQSGEASYAFDRFRLSADGTLLVRDGVAIALAPKVLQILLMLVQHAGEVVRKEHLLRAVWPDSFVEDTGLTRNVSVLRRALGDDGQQFVVTVARIGYRFVAPVVRIARPQAAKRDQPPRPRAETLRREPGQLVVGRGAELKWLRERFDAACEGHGGILGIVGEPGIGKTTLVETFLESIGDRCDIGRGRCSERLAGA